jgi:hypothetical protein
MATDWSLEYVPALGLNVGVETLSEGIEPTTRCDVVLDGAVLGEAVLDGVALGAVVLADVVVGEVVSCGVVPGAWQLVSERLMKDMVASKTIVRVDIFSQESPIYQSLSSIPHTGVYRHRRASRNLADVTAGFVLLALAAMQIVSAAGR